MLDSIEISNFKAIGTDKLVLKDLKSVNYLVGPNGCGKSSVLEGVRFYYITLPKDKNTLYGIRLLMFSDLKNGVKHDNNQYKVQTTDKNIHIDYRLDQQLIEIFSQGNSNIKLVFNKKVLEFSINKEFVEHKIFFSKKSSPIKPFLINLNSSETAEDRNPQLLHSSLFFTMNVFKKNKKDGDFFKIFEEEYKKTIRTDIIESRKIIINELSKIADIYENKGTNITYNFAKKLVEQKISETLDDDFYKRSSGQNNLILLIVLIIFLHNMLKINILLLEEIETNLHPNFQKLLPSLLKEISKEFNLQFLISTHSPFIISAAGQFDDTQRVYMIKEGEVMDKNEKKKSEPGFNTEAEKGYHGTQVAGVVAKMLGAEGADLGYPENIILVEEGSKKELLEAFFQRSDINKNIQVIQAAFGGDAELPNFDKLVKELIGLNSFFQQNISFSDKYIVFCDYVDEYYNDQNLEWIKKSAKDKANTHNKAMNMKLSLGDRFIAKYSELEKMYPQRFIDEKYPDWDKKITFKNFLKAQNIENAGKLKCEFAKYVGENMTKLEFEEFCPELYNLIFT